MILINGSKRGVPIARPRIIEAPPIPLLDTELMARLFRVLGEATRLKILELLIQEGELHQMELVRRLGATQSRISEHLACLSWCGFVAVARTEGRRTYYEVADPRVAELVERGRSLLHDNVAEIGCCRIVDRGE